MDSAQMPPVRPVTPMQSGGAVSPMGPGMVGGPGGLNGSGPALAPNGMPMVQQVQMASAKKNTADLIKIIAIVVLAVALVIFIGLFVWKFIEADNLATDWEAETSKAVAEAEDAVRMEEAEKYAEQIKYPYETFTGPADYGQLSFQYPKTWSVYIDSAATTGGDFQAFLNPVQVDKVGEESSLYALRVTIYSSRQYDEIIAEYQDQVDDEDVEFNVETMQIDNAQKTSVQSYTGTIPNTEYEGRVVVFRIRDKTVVLQTDSTKGFEAEFDKLLGTITYNA